MSLTAAALAAAFGSGLANWHSQSQSNDIAVNQYDRNFQWQKYQYEDMKRWQSPANQVRLYRQAGINPALAMYGGSSVSPLSSVGGVQPNASVAPQDMSFIPSAAGNLLSALSGNQVNESTISLNNSMAEKANQDAIGSAIDNMYKNEDWMKTIEGKSLANALVGHQGKIASLQSQLDERTLGSKIEQQEWQAQYWRASASSALIAAKYAEPMAEQQLKVGLSQIFMNYAQGNSSIKMAMNDANRLYAQFGKTEEDRKEFFLQTLDNLREVGNESRARQYGEWWKGISSFNIPTPIGAYNAGETHNRQNRHNWRVNKWYYGSGNYD